MTRLFSFLFSAMFAFSANVAVFAYDIPTGDGVLKLNFLKNNAVRVVYVPNGVKAYQLPDYYYVTSDEVEPNVSEFEGSRVVLSVGDFVVAYDKSTQDLTFQQGAKTLLTTNSHSFAVNNHEGIVTYDVKQSFNQQVDEHVYGLGQFQDGWNEVGNIARRLTQVNTQIAVPMVISSKGYGILWNNYGLTEFNECENATEMKGMSGSGEAYTVDATSTHGNNRETRYSSSYEVKIKVDKSGDYRFLLDVGQSMARKHVIVVDGDTIVHNENMWLPPTTSTLVRLSAGEHTILFHGAKGDKPVLHWGIDKAEISFRSPMASAIDYTIFVGSADEVIASYREVTGPSPMLPRWMFGYIHCRERYVSSEDILVNAREFRKRNIPIDVIVQDWQWWGKYGWNAMQFDEDHYPDPKALTEELHGMDIKLMLSVWSKIDKNCEVGREANLRGYFVDGTDWIDFMNEAAANYYWDNFSKRLIPTGVDSWWQDATEPENDDLFGRKVKDKSLPGELFRNIYTLFVNKTVYEGLAKDKAGMRSSILTRSGCAGIQRYGSVTWSGDVNNDWNAFKKQIIGGLGQNAAGLPWWTYDAGGFFRPRDQYENEDYKERLCRWIQTAVFLPFMRVHGYMSQTEPWRYGEKTEANIVRQIKLRYKLLPYIYSNAARVSSEGYTMMRSFVFDFAKDVKALENPQKTDFMCGDALLVSPITEGGQKEWKTYLPQSAGWYAFDTNKYFKGGKEIKTKVSLESIPVFVKAGSIIPMAGEEMSNSSRVNEASLEVRVYTGADASFVYYEDDGLTTQYSEGEYSRIRMEWNEATKKFTISAPEGKFEGSAEKKVVVRIITPKKEIKKTVTKGEIIKKNGMTFDI